jgi:predicted GNAT family N-acyltransferase
MGHSIIIKSANTADDMKVLFEIRRKVFVDEQGVNEREEYDEFETSSTHLLAALDGTPVGTCRYRNTDKGIKLERYAVLSAYRNHQVGSQLLKHFLSQINHNKYIYLHAQVQAAAFYAKYGFEVVGEQFEEAGIQHFKMVFKGKA